jgi:hypothetical protein
MTRLRASSAPAGSCDIEMNASNSFNMVLVPIRKPAVWGLSPRNAESQTTEP